MLITVRNIYKKRGRDLRHQAPSTRPHNEKRTKYIPASISNSLRDRLANKYVPAIAGRIQTTDTRREVINPSTAPCPDITALRPAIAKKCMIAVPPNMSGAFNLSGKPAGKFSLVQYLPKRKGRCQRNPGINDMTVRTITCIH